MPARMTLSIHTRRQLRYAEGYLTLGLREEAAQALDEIAEAEAEASEVLVLRLALHTERGEWARAARAGKVLCEREPQTAAYWIQGAYAARRDKGLTEAREMLMRGVGLHPREAVFHFNLACYEAQLGNLDDARVFLETACGLDESFRELAKTDDDLAPLRQA